MRIKLSLGALVLLLCSGGMVAGDDPRVTAPEVENLRTFVKLYGYVRYFHPSDEAAGIDWERFAIHGSLAVRSAPDGTALAIRLRELFGPIAPTLQIYDPLADSLPALPLIPDDTAGLETVAWQHRGVGLGPSPIYRSARTHRKNPVGGGHGFGTITQGVDAAPHRGREIRL